MNWFIWLVVALIAALVFAVFRARGRRGSVVTVVAPKLGFVNFGNNIFASLVKEDQSALSGCFSHTLQSAEGAVPTCDVLFAYADLSPDGSLLGAPEPTIRHLAARAHAAIVVLASPNPGKNIIAAGKLPGPKNASLVFTIDRKNDFANFFKELFSLMRRGKSMPVAWSTMAPQHLSAMRPGIPETIFVPESGAVTFQ